MLQGYKQTSSPFLLCISLFQKKTDWSASTKRLVPTKTTGICWAAGPSTCLLTPSCLYQVHGVQTKQVSCKQDTSSRGIQKAHNPASSLLSVPGSTRASPVVCTFCIQTSSDVKGLYLLHSKTSYHHSTPLPTIHTENTTPSVLVAGRTPFVP